MIKKEELTLKSNYDGLELGVSIRTPASKPTAILQIVHGMAEHRERYHEFMEFCAEAGIMTVIHDHRGHGESVLSPEDYGYFGENGADALVQDAHQVTEFIRERYSTKSLTLLGHSMGSLVARCYLKEYDRELDGLIICGSPSKQFGAKVGLVVARILARFQGGRHRSEFINKLAFGRNNKKFDEVISPNSWLVSDPAIVAAYDADERDGFVFTLNGFEVLFTLMNRAYSKKGWFVQNPNLPILFIAGADDPCIISERKFNKAVNFLRQRGYHDVDSKLYPHMRHEILNEFDKEQVWADVIEQVRSAE